MNSIALARVRDSLLLSRCVLRILTNLLVPLFVHLRQAVGVDTLSDKFGEVCLVFRWIFLLQHLHVLLDMGAEDPVLVHFGIVLAFLTLLIGGLVAREVFRAV